ncbi:MAG TPA: von Willebrand factor type A domain-containing protein [Fimbriiglobus sp.]|nr:von Willebrand factor type A domain-containing protein [Fimbriiglobus sp.]
MTTDEHDSRLTAYALNDPGLSADDRLAVEETLRNDPAARQELQETLKLAQLLAAGLAAEQAALPAEAPVTVPLSVANKPRRRGWKMYATAAGVMIAVLGGLYATFGHQKVREAARRTQAEHVAALDMQAERDLAGGLKHLSSIQDEATGRRPMSALEPSPTWRQAAGMPGPEDFARMPGGMPGESGPASGVPGGVPGIPMGLAPAGPEAKPGRPASPAQPPVNDLAQFQPIPQPGTTFEPIHQPDAPTDRIPNDRYPALVENKFVAVAGQDALSTFGVDVDTASYSIVRKYLTMGQMPPASAVRLEELVNYFPYQDRAPTGDDPFAVTVELGECPWQPKHRLARIGLKAKPIATDKRPPSNLVFLVDVSGSMNEPNKLPLVKASLRMLVNQLGENDRVAMVVYAGAAGMVLDSTSAMHKDRILAAIDKLEAGGSTNGEGGLRQAYGVAAANFIKSGTNRVILCTDGDWNVGTTGTADLVKLIEEKRQTGVFLSVFGFGMGNLRDEMMVQLAGKGNGNYGYIDTLKEANKALVEQLGGTLVTVAKDVKIQVEFNPAKVGAYRLLGYEKRALAAKDFHDDTKDAGEMGAGHVVTALYELVPAGGVAPGGAKPDGLRYQSDPAPKPAAAGGEAAKESFVVKMRHKKPDRDTSTYRELPVTDPGRGYAEASEDFRFAAAVASFAMLLRESQYKGESSFALVQELAESAKKHDPSGYRAEFLELVKRAKAVSGRP